MEKKFGQKSKRILYKGMSILLTFSMVTGSVILSPIWGIQVANAEEAQTSEALVTKGAEAQVTQTTGAQVTLEAQANTISSMNYFSANDGPIISKSGVNDASYGFVMPVFNNGASTWADVSSDLQVSVKVNGNWINIDNVSSFVYNSNWGNWSDGGFNGYWFKVSQTTEIRLSSKSNSNVFLDYTLEFTKLSESVITSMKATQGPNITAGVTGGAGFTYPTFNNDSSIKYEQVAKDLKLYIWSDEKSQWVDVDNNAASGWIYDKNFGQFTDGGGGFWFTVSKTTKVRLASKSSSDVYLDYVINYEEPVRSTWKVSADTTTYTAGDTGAIGIPLPKIDGSYPRSSDLNGFVYEIKVNDNWVELGDSSASGFSYQGNGYNKLSDKNQWGYWVDSIYGLWFQPIQKDMQLRIGYPKDGVKGDPVEDNYVYYNFIGNPNAPRPDVSDLGNINLGTTDNAKIDGWNLVWDDEFSGSSLDTSKWGYNTGYYMNSDPSSWGWGNNEQEYYTDKEKNVSVKDGNLNLTAYDEPTTFPQIDPNRVAEYSSGKITTKDKFTFKYGRIDFRAKLPAGTGLWPALWLLPNDDTYGSWAASGEIDVMEARGRLPGATSGTIHFGGAWPANTHLGSDYSFSDGQRIDTDYHVYSAVWEDDNIKWYVDGKCFFKATKDQWYSLGAKGNDKAPFDQNFYIIMNLAVGGWFDGGLTPNAGEIPATMKVDYVRVYKADGDVQAPTTPETYVDVAAGKIPTCSGTENDVFSINNLTDGNTDTRWSSNFADDAWFVVDLGDTYKINELDFNWEASYGKQYEILVSEDGVNYTSAYKQTNGSGGMEKISFDAKNARYVKFQGIERALPYGYSLWDMKVMGTK
ncbi:MULTISPECIES: family 16 glycosylhydrolase [unclassified Clostridium]|uniref:galactose-binding domain-containing protein n=1 Tax=unclassified Clostridium TaxID=2614128 RepID=UPI0002978438|nr:MULTISPECIES: family 16 glycosylhydrolase [unclassified Clostridium]EKQ50207.1 MAG: beta-glucanase/beta-glucan synthetase [Clostridium sp. Maddingley MBC34-26]